MRRDLPSGTVTFVFTDIAGSTKLLDELGEERYAHELAQHRVALRAAFTRHEGVEVDTQGDAFFFAFPTATQALEATTEGAHALERGPIRVRMGVHTGTPHLSGDGYVGMDVHRASRIANAGHGGQVLVSATTAVLVDTDRFELLDLGRHRLKDLVKPERIFQLGSGSFPPVRGPSASNLPVPATPFLGRSRELEQVRELLTDRDVRLVTLTGPGGIGKTRLALQVAAETLDAYPNGTWWLPLAPLHDADAVLPAILACMGSQGSTPEAVAGVRALLVIDNAEHLMPGVADVVGAVVAVDGPTLLVTSRERLRLSSELVWPVPPLDETDGRALFVARARAHDPRISPDDDVNALCDRLEQLPLAIELAAARISLFTPRQLLERVGRRLDELTGARDADPRQRTLRATLEWSHDLLSAEEQVLFRRMSAFVGGCDLEAIEQVCASDLAVLESLLDKSLVRRRMTDEGPRFVMLETIREYAAERLAASGELQEVVSRHTEHYAALSQRYATTDTILTGMLEAEAGNLRAATVRARELGDGHLILRLAAGALTAVFQGAGSLAAAREFVALGLEAESEEGQLRARGLTLLSFIAYREGDYETAMDAAHQAVELAREIGNDLELANAIVGIGAVAAARGDHLEGVRRMEEARTVYRRIGNRSGEGVALANLGDFAASAGEHERAAELFREALDVFADVHDAFGEAHARINLAAACVHLVRLDEAAEHARWCLRRYQRLGDDLGVGTGFQVMAGVALARADHDAAARLLGAADAARDAIGAVLEPTERAEHDRIHRELTQLLGVEEFDRRYAAGRATSSEAALALALGGRTLIPR
jgi:predicted ATPase/class 3 adenylate cyclase